MEGGAFVTYIVDTYGWEGLGILCEAASDSAVDGDYERLEVGLRALGIGSLSEFETTWKTWLVSEVVFEADLAKLDAELQLLDTMRDYQLAYDTGAHFLEGILFSPEEGARRNIVADFVRRPRDADAISLELLLVMAQDALRREVIEDVKTIMNEITAVLVGGFPETGLAADVHAVVALALAKGLEPFRLTEHRDGSFEMHALAYATWPEASAFEVDREGDSWVLREVMVDE